MDKQEFITKFNGVEAVLDMEHVDEVITSCIDRVHDKYPQYERGCMNINSAMEEAAEFIQALSIRKRGRTKDNYNILEEAADVIMAIWCVGQIYGFSHEELLKAINVKIEREVERIEQHKQGLYTQ